MILLILIIAVVFIWRNYRPDFEYLEKEKLFVIFYSAKNGERKRIIIRNIIK